MDKLKIFIICNKILEKDRYNHSIEQLKKISKNKIEIEYFSHIWAKDITNDIYNKYCKTDNSMRYHGRLMNIKPLTKGEVSLVLNHIECLKKISKMYKNGYFLILESDFILTDNFELNIKNLLNSIEDKKINFDIINIGKGFRPEHTRSYNIDKCYNINTDLNLKISNKNCCTEAILWNMNSINKFLNYFEKEQDINGPWDTILDEFHHIISKWELFWLYPYIVYQGSINGKFVSVIH